MTAAKFLCTCSASFDTEAEFIRHLAKNDGTHFRSYASAGNPVTDRFLRERHLCHCGLFFETAVGLSQHLEHFASSAERHFSVGAELPRLASSFLRHLREQNVSRCVRYGHGDPTEWLELTEVLRLGQWGPMQWGCAIAGEAGELCNFLKKFERRLPSDPTRLELESQIAGEIADVIIYLDLLASMFGFDLERIIATKFNRTSEKLGYPERIEQ